MTGNGLCPTQTVGGTRWDRTTQADEASPIYEPPTLEVIGKIEDLTKVTVTVLEGSICQNYVTHVKCVN